MSLLSGEWAALKIVILPVWFHLVSHFWYTEVSEIVARIQLSRLTTDDVEQQRNTLWYLQFAAIFAVLVWIVSHIPALGISVMHYGYVEWILIVDTVFQGRRLVRSIGRLISKLNELTGLLKRYETPAGH